MKSGKKNKKLKTVKPKLLNASNKTCCKSLVETNQKESCYNP